MNAAPRVEIKQSIVPDTIWRWYVIMESGHCFCISGAFDSFEKAAQDAARNAGAAMRIATAHMEEIG